MDWRGDIEDCCSHMNSSKVTERKKFCEKLSNLLDKKDVVDLLNDGKFITWKQVISSVQECLRRDADKMIEDAKKKGATVKYPSPDLFIQVVKTALKEDADNLDIPCLMGYIIGCMRDYKMKTSYENTFVCIIHKYIIPNPKCRGKLNCDNWTDIYTFLKKLCEEKPNDIWVYKCFMLTIKLGPLSGFPPLLLREQFNYITALCQAITPSSPRPQQEDVLEIAIHFCKHTCKDNRISCCKFGENVFSKFISLYEQNGKEAKIKEQLIDFFYLQTVIHQPNGVFEGHPCAYADDWGIWKRCLKMIYSLLSKEIDFYFLYRQKNTSFFSINTELMSLSEEFLSLFIEVSRQVFMSPYLDASTSADNILTIQDSQKRQKIDISLNSYIKNIEETKSWLWINIVCVIIQRYTELLDIDGYVDLLNILSTIQIESNDFNAIDKAYGCLSVLAEVSNVDTSSHQLEIDELWKIIGESTTRAFGLNQHKEATEILLKKLIVKGIVDSDTILQSYSSVRRNISLQSINTLEISLLYVHFSKSDVSKKEILMNCILNPQNLKDYDYLVHNKTAVLLVNLTLKQWQANESVEKEQKLDKYGDVKKIYRLSLFKENVVQPENNDNNAIEKNYNVDENILNLLIERLENFIQNMPHSIEIILSSIILLVNILSCMVDYKIIKEKELRSFKLTTLLQQLFRHENIKTFEIFRNKDEREIKKLLGYIRILDKMFSLKVNVFIMKILKDLVPFELLKSLMYILNDLQEEHQKNSEIKFELKKAILKTMSSFSCISDNFLNDNQKKILEVISAPNYNCNLEDDYILLLTFLKTFKYAKAGVISNDIFNCVLYSVQEVCTARYQCTENAIEILNILHDLYPHLALSVDNESQISSVGLLEPFYQNRHNYGLEVSIALLKCLERLIQVDSQNKFSYWSESEVIKFVPEFLCSDYQEVRFKAIETLVVFFQVNSQSKELQNFHRQEEIFSKIYDMSLRVFEVSDELSNEHKIDEIISRTASVLHTFTAIMINCNIWIEDCLFALVKLSSRKKMESIDKILLIITEHFMKQSEINIMEKYLERILEKWLNEGYDIQDFQFKLFNCNDKTEFYLKYFELCVPFLIVKDRKDIISAAKKLELTEKDIVEKTCSKIFSQALSRNVDNVSEELIKSNNILAYYTHVVGQDDLKKLLVNDLEHILLIILDYLTDEVYIHDTLGASVIFLTTHLSTEHITTCFSFIEEFLCEHLKIPAFLTEHKLSKLEKILLALKSNIYMLFTDDDKIKALHRYTFFINMVTENLTVESSWQDFFIRDTIYGLINLITHQKKFTNFTLATVMFLTRYLRKILPTFSETFEKFLTFTTNSLKHFAMTYPIIRKNCLEILQFLIVENSCYLMSGIEKLDNFPQNQDFEKIHTVHRNIKYGRREASLEQEIDFFLEHGDLSTRQDSLIHLKNVLANKKVQLKAMYDKLQEVRGFSEDCKKSAIHRLICSLAKMSSSTDEMVSFQAINCLGELGPTNLMTLVLQPERTMSDQNWLPFELLTGNVISLLSEYIVDSDIKVVETASKLLYVILDWKESRKIAEAGKDFGHGLIHQKYIYPYFPLVKSSPSSNVAVDSNLFVSKITKDELWFPSEAVTHKEWIVSLVTSLLEIFTYRSYLPKLVPVCRVKPKFAEQILPLIINLLLYLNNKNVVEVLSLKIDNFFSLHWQYMVPKSITTESITVNKKSVKCMLNVISIVRLQRSFNLTKARFVGELELNYLKVAKAAEFCTAHFTALLYSDLWCQTIIEDIQNQNKTYCEQRSTMLDIIYESQGEEIGEALQNILRNAYKAVGDLDALPGCGISYLLKPKSRVEHYKELGKWDQVTRFYAMQFNGLNSNVQELMESFKKCSLYQIPLLCTQQFDEPPYECLWRLGQWNTINKRQITVDNTMKPEDFEKYRYYALNSLNDRNQCLFKDFKKLQCLCVIEDLKHTSLESSQNMYPILTRLQSVVEMEDFAKGCDSKNFINILKKWDQQKELVTKNDYQYFEPIIAQRISMLNDYLKLHSDDSLKSYLVDMTLDLANLAKDEGFFKEGLTVLENLRCMSGLSDDVKVKIQLMDAQLSWLVNDKLVARHILNTLCKSDISPKSKATALKLSGQYMSETYSENRFTIIRNYFMESLTVMKDLDRTKEDFNSVLDTYDKLAQFADREYQQIMAYMKSDLFQRKIKNMEKAKQEASSIQKQRQKTLDENKAAVTHNRQSSIDQTEINNTKQESNQLLVIALKFYLLNLHHCESNNIQIFRIISLFLENRNNPEICNPINNYLPKIPSYKYIIMLPQLIPHITENNTDLFSEKVNEIVEKCATEHPHHTLPLLLSLANSNKDKEFTNQKTKTLANDTRVATANKLLAKLKKQGKLKEHINKLQQLSIALIDLAYKDIDASEKKNRYEISRNQMIMKIQNFDDILLPTYHLKINVEGNYSQIVGITGFKNFYHPVGGINHPKRIKCRGTDGKEWSQLVKGHDDLRQDAVMQQVFSIMNSLLSCNKQTRNLLIRTYKIVPLSMRSGILEWVDDSMPIGLYLVGEDGKSGAHLQYRSNDRTSSSCRELFKRCVGKAAEEKQKTYSTICQSFKPVFHKFFQDSFPQPTIWYERQRAYIYSVATTSMCGYVLGIGDRHVSNILIDKTTAEVVHIDFGIAFEQGKVLPTPETVPFRLTRDIVDGMGASGVEGLFRRSCEKTMEVLRQNAQTIITILEVLLYDPLYAWTVTCAEANRRQTDEDFSNVSPESSSDEEHSTVNITAERALLRLREKLQGTELGHPTSIEHQVGTLIQQAIDPANLCKLFVGWQPYL